MTITPATDAELSHAIRSALDRSPDVDSFDVQVQVRLGRVQLSGAVGSFAERLSVRNAVTAFVGSDRIDSTLRVRATSDSLRVGDDDLLEAGRHALGDESSAVLVSVDQRVATLAGSVPTYAQRAHARHLVESIAGISFVINDVTVD